VVEGLAAALTGFERAHLAAGPDVGTRMPCRRQVVVVERVLGAVVAADVAFADEPPRLTGAPVDVGPCLSDRLPRYRRSSRLGRERHRQLRQEPVEASLLRSRLEG